MLTIAYPADTKEHHHQLFLCPFDECKSNIHSLLALVWFPPTPEGNIWQFSCFFFTSKSLTLSVCQFKPRGFSRTLSMVLHKSKHLTSGTFYHFLQQQLAQPGQVVCPWDIFMLTLTPYMSKLWIKLGLFAVFVRYMNTSWNINKGTNLRSHCWFVTQLNSRGTTYGRSLPIVPVAQ